MHPLHQYLSQQIAEQLKGRQVVVWYDSTKDFTPFIKDAATPGVGKLRALKLDGLDCWLAEFDGSFLELRTVIEPIVSKDSSENLLVYVPGVERDRRSSMLMEIEKAGQCYEPQLKRIARNVLRPKYTDGVIDELLRSNSFSYEDLAHASAGKTGSEPPSILKSVFNAVSGNEGLLTAWLADDSHDANILKKHAVEELVKLVTARIGLNLAANEKLSKLRIVVWRFILANEFRSDLSCASPSVLDSIGKAESNEFKKAVSEIAKTLRKEHGDLYASIADQIEQELGLKGLALPANALGKIDTFRFEEGVLLSHCGNLISQKQFDEAIEIIVGRENSFWLERDVPRKALWEACRRMADLGKTAERIQKEIKASSIDAVGLLENYTMKNGWHLLDLHQRRLETWLANLDEEAEEKALIVVRRAYEETCSLLAERFTHALAKLNWTIPGSLHQTNIQSKVLSNVPKPVAYFMVDAMRFEMGVELSERLPKAAEVSLRPAITALPSITPVGMAALLPGASANFSVVEQNGKLGSRIQSTFLPDLTARKKYFLTEVPGLVDLTLDEVLSLPQSKLKKKVDGALNIVVRSQEIDHAGEAGFTFQARQVMDNVIDNLARAVRRMAAIGIENSVISADHGHLFFPVDRDESMRIEAPGGKQIDLHRRCWIGRGGATPPGSIRVSGVSLGYDTDLEFVFPINTAVFKAGGDLAFHHGGTSLQEMVIPVISVQLKVSETNKGPGGTTIVPEALPTAITNRIFSVTLQLGQNLSLLSTAMQVRPLLVSAGKQVGAVGMATGTELDRESGCIKLEAGKPATVAFLLSDETAPSLRVVILDPATDAELFKSAEIPVRLGV